MAIMEINELSFSYGEEEQKALSDISLAIEPGEFVVLCGASGCGKTTLLRQMKPEYTPFGKRSGEVLYRNRPLASYPAQERAREVAMVWQHPEQQIVLDDVSRELVFSMENVGLPYEVMRRRLAETVQFFGLEPLFKRSIHQLSGGEKQRINIASVMMLHPLILLFDEPTAQLDPVAARECLDMIYRINRECGVTVVMSEHRLEDVFGMADRVIWMEAGRIRYEGSPAAVAIKMWADRNDTASAFLPTLTRWYLEQTVQPDEQHVPFTVREARQWFMQQACIAEEAAVSMESCEEKCEHTPQSLLSCRDITFTYEKGTPPVLYKLSLAIQRGEWLAILGGNGSGKSTLLHVLAGLVTPQRGAVQLLDKPLHRYKERERYERIGYLAQNPLLYFNQDTVREELEQAGRFARTMNDSEGWKQIAREFGLEEIVDKHPHDISAGQQQKTALACLLLSNPDVLLLDEPTKGLDPHAKRQLACKLAECKEKGTTIVMVTHDMEFAATYASRCALLFNGEITVESTPDQFFGGNYFYTTILNRAVRDFWPSVLTEKDVKPCQVQQDLG